MSRRRLVGMAAMAVAAASVPTRLEAAPPRPRGRVFVVGRQDRAAAVAASLEAVGNVRCEDRETVIKANFNSDDAFPASTHPATLAALVAELRRRGAAGVTLAERSGMGETRRVLEQTGASTVLRDAGGRVVVLDELGAEGWRRLAADHWPRGFYAARLFTDSACVVHTMCCKTHRFGGHVTLALKNTVGVLAKRVPGMGHDFMRDLHGSDHQRAMIAEANLAWKPAVNVMDCLEAFVDGGPERGKRVAPGVFLASDDRCALDGAAIALLRLHGMRGPAARGPIAGTDQLERAVALGLGAAPGDVDVVAADPAVRDVARRLQDQLAAG